MFNESMFFWQTSSGKSRNRVCEIRKWQIRVSHPPKSHVRVHDQLHPQVKAPTRKVHDEQCPGKFHHITGK